MPDPHHPAVSSGGVGGKAPDEDDGFVDAFWADSWLDHAAIHRNYSPRGFRSVGPFRTFAEARNHVPKHRPEATHFKVRKLIVKAKHVRFIEDDMPPT